jgi:hypothetical protein
MRTFYSKSYLAAIAVITATWLGACTTDGKVTIECTINEKTEKIETTADKTDCDVFRAKAKAGQALTTAETPPVTTNTTTPTPANASKPKGKPNLKPPFEAPLVAGKPPISGLIEPTNKIKRQEELNSKVGTEKRDPFTAIPGSLPAPPPAVVVKAPTLPTPTVRVKDPEPPSTAEASAVLVTGIMDIGGTKYALVNAPGEPTSRAIAVGQKFISNQVLLKRIDNVTSTPLIILEQNGVEVTRPIGQPVVAALPNANSTAPALTNINPDGDRPPSGVILPPATKAR